MERNLAARADRVAVRHIDHRTGSELRSWSYAEMWAFAGAVAGQLSSLGVARGDRVALRLPNGIELISSLYGAWLAGAAAVPGDSMASQPELRHQLEDSGARVLLCREQDRATSLEASAGLDVAIHAPCLDARPLSAPREVEPERDLAVLMYTGGTTGTPKGAALTHRNITVNVEQFATWYQLENAEERCVSVLPMFHSGGMAGALNVPLARGAELLLMERFNPKVVARTVERYRATRLFGVPTMYLRILDDDQARQADFSSLRACRTSAAPLPPAVKEQFDELVGHEVLVEGYGLSEASPLTHANPILRPRAGSIGLPLPDTDARIVDDSGREMPAGQPGELLIRGPQIMAGYWNRPAETASALQEGWLRTGDVASMDDDGYFRIVDRKKESIISGGYKIWPREVEDVLYQHPAVKMDAVVGVPDPSRGEMVKAYVVLHEDAPDVSSEDIRSFAHERLAPYKVPRAVEFVKDIPVSPQGKVLRRELRGRESR